MTAKQKWVVGIDLRQRSDGAVRFGTWLHTQAPQAVELVGVHVLEPDELDLLATRSRTREQMRLAAEQTLDRADARAAFVGVDVVEADHPVTALETTLRRESAHGIIIGRRAAGDSAALIRLGSVARRMLRRLVAPTFVVPPDFDVAQLGDGPILVAVTPDEASVGAVKVARVLAAALRRPLQFVRAVSTPTKYVPLDRADAVLAEREAQQQRAADALTQSWLIEQGATGPLLTRRGDELSVIMAAAAAHAAPFVVCGSRLLSALERVFGLSVSSELAAQATTPVLVVPSDAGA